MFTKNQIVALKNRTVKISGLYNNNNNNNIGDDDGDIGVDCYPDKWPDSDN